MELFERRGYFHCSHCGTFSFIDTPPVDGVRVLTRDRTALPCPLCGLPLAKAMLDDTHAVQHCERCRGLLLERATFADAVARRRARERGSGVPPAPLDPRELRRNVMCPACRQRMDVHPYFGPGNVVIDSCTACNLIWLDHGELRQIGEAPGRDRGQLPAQSASAVAAAAPSGETGRLSLLQVFDIISG